MRPIAFYAPMKSPDHPTPSGDRQIARNIMAALEAALERQVRLMSDLRSFEPKGDAAAQSDLMHAAQEDCARILKASPAPALWVTYHNYYKAPDLIGPTVARALGIAYVQIEASRAQSRLTGPWSQFAQAAHDASDAAGVIFHVTQHDLIALSRDRFGDQAIVELPPFLNRDSLPDASPLTGPILSVGMMRHGDKMASYTLIAKTLAGLTGEWHLQIVGDGDARAEVEALFAPFGPRVSFLGAVEPGALAGLYASSGMFFWPGVNEAFGMVYLEAQAAGLPVVAQDRPGVRDVLAPGNYPTVEEDAEGLRARLNALLTDTDMRKDLGAEARAYVEGRHLRPAAMSILRKTLSPLMERGA